MEQALVLYYTTKDSILSITNIMYLVHGIHSGSNQKEKEFLFSGSPL
jgi:hypothetical protein